MRNPSELYELTTIGAAAPEGLPLIVGLTGFTDAGSAVGQLGDYLLDALDGRVAVEFDADILLDYRARRPIIRFEQDHLSEFQAPTLRVYLMRDELGEQFWFLTGFEPDFQWERVVAAVTELITRFKVSTTSWVHSIPMPVPHTRPIRVTVSGNRIELIDAMSVWKPHTQVPSNMLHLMEYRLQQLGHPVAGFALLVPHYLGDTEYPGATLTALDSLAAATGLIFPTDRLREENREFLTKIDEQVHSNAELERLVGTLEERHDAYMEGTSLRSPLTDEAGELPSADEIAAELENFLAFRRRGDDGAPPSAP